VPLLPLIGHESTRARFLAAIRTDRLPAALLLHGPAGTGKERLALWLAQRLLCDAPVNDGACGTCPQCRYVVQGAHPDLQWYVPRIRDEKWTSTTDPAVILADMAEGIEERIQGTNKKEPNGLWLPDDPKAGYFINTTRALGERAILSPAMAKRRIILIPDVELMVVQAGNDSAANAFLKLLEEPPVTTTIILTSSAPSSLLPTIRSRCVSVRVPVLTADACATFVALPDVAAALDDAKIPAGAARRAQLAAGRPGLLLGGTANDTARHTATVLLEAARGTPVGRYEAAFRQGNAGARGAFSDALDALTVLLRDEAERAAAAGRDEAARKAAQAVVRVEHAKAEAYGNVTPSLVTAALLTDLAPLV
jgi:DNA polymerase-3 subunit delta'